MAGRMPLISLVLSVLSLLTLSSGQVQVGNDIMLDPEYLDPEAENVLVKLPEGVPLGASGHEDTLIIWRNGIVTFGLDLTADVKQPTRNFSKVDVKYFLAPLWFPSVSADILTTNVSWESESAQLGDGPGYILQFASEAVSNYSDQYFGQPTEFNPTWAMVVNWNVTLLPRSEDRQEICSDYYACDCDGEGSGSGSINLECDTVLCYYNQGWSAIDVAYLKLLCDARFVDDFRDENSYYIYEFGLQVHFWLVLATDGVNTQAVFLYLCNNIFDSHFDIFPFIYNQTAVGYRLDTINYNDTCISSQIYRLLRCSLHFHGGCGNTFDNEYHGLIETVFYNFTNIFSNFLVFEDLKEGIDYIPFLSPVDNFTYTLNYTQFNDTRGVVFLPRWLDGSSDPIPHSGLGVGTTTQNNIYVGTNGVISFGRRFYFWYSQRFPTRYPWIRDTYVAAPFWHDVDIRSSGDVFYSVLKPEDDITAPIFDTVNKFLQYHENITFKADWMLVAMWNQVPVYPHYYVQRYPQYYSDRFRETILYNTNTFEAILVSSGPDTYVIYTYNCYLLTNPGTYNKAVIGYNLGGFEYSNHGYSESVVANRVACGNWPSSEWYNEVYKLNTGEDVILQAQRECRALVAEDKKSYPERVIRAYQKDLSPCPCSIWNAWRDRNYRWDSDNFYCYYRRFPNLLTDDFDQYCCYDSNFQDGTWGALLKSGYRGSGMAQLVQSSWKRTVSSRDVEMKRVCCGLAGLCDLYLSRRPPNDCTGYEPPVWTWAWGDPHLTTLDGVSYTFNGYGEYVLLRHNDNIEFQGRMRPTEGAQATQFSSFAIGYIDGSRVEVNCDNPQPFCTTFYNDTIISSELMAVNDSFFSSSDKIEVVRESETTVTVVMGEGITLAVTYNASAMIPSFQLTLDPSLTTNTSTMQGLLGSKDGNPSNDLTFRNRTVLNMTTASDRQIFDFGNDWLILIGDESFFNHPEGEGPLDFHDSSWVPAFTSDVLASADQAVIDSCTPDGATQPVEQCVFDAEQTNDINIGMATLNTLNDNNLAMAESTNMPPVISSQEDIIRVNISVPVTHLLSVRDDGTMYPPLYLVHTPVGASLGGVQGNYTFIWSFGGLEEEEEVSPLVFFANDSMGATATYTPQLEVCACRNGANCTLEGVADLTAEVIIMNCICPPAWEGRYCQEDVDGCLEFACLEGVECSDVPAPGEGAECGPCPTGYTDDGNKCADLDECQSGEPCEQVCTNTEGSFECSCNHGYQIDPDDPNGCVDIDECGLFLAGCDQYCNNTDGSFDCSCGDGFISRSTSCTPEEACQSSICGTALCARINGIDTCYCAAGYDLNEDTNECGDIDECAYGFCGQQCTNVPGTFVCGCSDGYELGADRLSCQDIDECLLAAMRGEQPCADSEVCYNSDGGYMCVCAPGQYRVSGVCASPIVREDYTDQSIRATFTSITETKLLAPGTLDNLSMLVTSVVKGYCSVEECEIDKTEVAAATKREAPLLFDPDNDRVQAVFDIEGVVSMDGGVAITFYVEVFTDSGETGVIVAEDVVDALNANIADFKAVFGDVVFTPVIPPPGPSVTAATQPEDVEEEVSIAVVAGVTAGAAVMALLSAVSLALVLYCCIEYRSKKKNSGQNIDRRALLTEGLVMPDGKGGGASEMKEVPPPPRMTEDPGTTIIIVNPAT